DRVVTGLQLRPRLLRRDGANPRHEALPGCGFLLLPSRRRGYSSGMSTARTLRCLSTAFLFPALALGCDQDEPRPGKPAGQPAARGPATKKVEVGKNVVLEIQGEKRRVLVRAEVCRRTDQLEQLLCRKRTKEHEAILAADVDARHIHTALILAGAEPGSPVRYVPKKTPPSG